MKYIDEYRDLKTAKEYSAAIDKITSKQWSIMEICGGQTHSIIKYGIDKIIPDKIKLHFLYITASTYKVVDL